MIRNIDGNPLILVCSQLYELFVVYNKQMQDHNIPEVISDEINESVEHFTKRLDRQKHYIQRI